MTDANGTKCFTIDLKRTHEMFTKQQLWETVVELSIENTILRKKLKRKSRKLRK